MIYLKAETILSVKLAFTLMNDALNTYTTSESVGKKLRNWNEKIIEIRRYAPYIIYRESSHMLLDRDDV